MEVLSIIFYLLITLVIMIAFFCFIDAMTTNKMSNDTSFNIFLSCSAIILFAWLAYQVGGHEFGKELVAQKILTYEQVIDSKGNVTNKLVPIKSN